MLTSAKHLIVLMTNRPFDWLTTCVIWNHSSDYSSSISSTKYQHETIRSRDYNRGFEIWIFDEINCGLEAANVGERPQRAKGGLSNHPIIHRKKVDIFKCKMYWFNRSCGLERLQDMFIMYTKKASKWVMLKMRKRVVTSQ